MSDNVLNFDREHHSEPDYPYDDDGSYLGSEWRARDLGDFLELIVIDDHVVSRNLKPIDGSEYEFIARELGRGRPVVPPPPPLPPVPAAHEEVLTWLSLLVGGEERLAAVGSTPLPQSEALDLDRVATRHREQMTGIDAQLTRVTELLFGPELLTAARRLLVRTAVAQPSFFKSTAGDEVLACATLTAVAKANDLVGQGRVVPVTLIRTMFNLRSAPNDKVQAMIRAVAPQGAFLGGWRRPLLDVPVPGWRRAGRAPRRGS